MAMLALASEANVDSQMPQGIVCLHADSALLVLAKPAGLLCVPGLALIPL